METSSGPIGEVIRQEYIQKNGLVIEFLSVACRSRSGVPSRRCEGREIRRSGPCAKTLSKPRWRISDKASSCERHAKPPELQAGNETQVSSCGASQHFR